MKRYHASGRIGFAKTDCTPSGFDSSRSSDPNVRRSESTQKLKVYPHSGSSSQNSGERGIFLSITAPAQP